MSNEQSPPVRKVPKFKKGGARQSPFSGMAFQFSGTALDVAIQQLQEEATSAPLPQEEQKESLVAETERENPASELPLQIEAASSQDVVAGTADQQSELRYPSLTSLREQANSPVINLRESVEPAKRPPSVTNSSLPPIAYPSFQSFVDRWRHGLHRGQLKMCEVLFNKTHAIGRSECETSFTVLMYESGLSRRQTFKVISELEKMGFVERLPPPKHSTKKGTGSNIRIHLMPRF